MNNEPQLAVTDDPLQEFKLATEHLLNCMQRAIDAERESRIASLRHIVATEEVKTLFSWCYVPQGSCSTVKDLIKKL
jgi:hypothetical protein